MSRKEKITQNLVNTTCNEMSAAKESITVSGVIKCIGGSFSTIGQMVKHWKAEQEKTKKIEALEMPDTVNTAFKKAVAEIWKTASDLASQEVQQARKEADRVVNQARGELSEALTEIARLESEREKNKTDKEDAEKKAVALFSDFSDFSEITANNKVLEARLNDREIELQRRQEQQDKKIIYFENEIKKANTEAEKKRSTLQAEFSEIKIKNSVLESQREDREKALQKEKDQQNKETLRTKTKQQERQKQHKEEVLTLKKTIQKNGRTKATAEKKISILQTEKNTLEKRSKSKENDLQKLQNQYEKLQNELLEIAKTKK